MKKVPFIALNLHSSCCPLKSKTNSDLKDDSKVNVTADWIEFDFVFWLLVDDARLRRRLDGPIRRIGLPKLRFAACTPKTGHIH